MLIGVDGYIPVKRFGEEKGLEMIKKAGFDGVDYSLLGDREVVLKGDVRESALQTKRLLDKYGLIAHQAHAPFRGFKYGDAMDLSCPAFADIVKAFEYAAIIGAPHIVVHGIRVPNGFSSDDNIEYNCRFYRSLAPYAKEFGIHIAIENVGAACTVPFMMNEVLRRLDDPIFVALIDIGHALLFRVPPECFISAVTPGMLKGLHVQDNDGNKDQHLIPGLGKINWENVLTALADAGYDGVFSLEVIHFFEKMPEEATFEALSLSDRP